MNTWLIPRDDKPSRRDRVQSAAARQFISDVQLAALKVDGVTALADHIVRGLDTLDDEVVLMAGLDERKARIFAEIETTAIVQCKVIQRSLNDPWGLS